MTPFQLGLLSFPTVLLLAAFRVPLAAAMLLVGLVGTFVLNGDARMMDNQLKTFAYRTFSNYSLSIIPLFLLMSEFATRGGMSAALFKAAEAWIGHRRGGLAYASIGASAGFGAICGSSLATASAMGRVALPELKRAGYSGALSTGSLAAGGTLGILIPPSIVLVIYAILAEQNIEKLFTAALVPALVAIVGYFLTIAIVTRLSDDWGRRLPRIPLSEKLESLTAVWPVMLIFTVVIGGIYAGFFSPTSAGAIGAAGTALVAFANHRLSISTLKEALLGTARNTGMIFFIVLAAAVFNSFLSAAQVPQTLAAFFLEGGYSPWTILVGILLLYLVLGTVMDSLAMIFLTVPIFVPIVTQLDFGIPPEEIGIWFGILVLMAAEVGLITPPVGLNLFVINALAKDVPLAQTYKGALPFVVSDIVRIALLATFPALTLILVRWLY
ncbi:MAG: TRAP transporter large permease [Pseudomonadota bacterium]